MPTATRTDPLSYLTDQLNELKTKGTHFNLRVLEDEQAPVCTFDGKKVVNLASNNYLGLTTHPNLREAALEATRKYGVGSGAVRTIAGTMKIHMELEEKIARFKNVEACVVFQSGFAANAGTVSAVLGKEDFIISDQLNHASIIDGARLSRAKILVFEHKNVADAEAKLASVKDQPGKKLLITDGVFSMDGDIGPQPALCDVAEKYGAITTSADHAISSTFSITVHGHFCFLPHIRLQLPQPALPLSTFWNRSRNESTNCGRTPASGKKSCRCSASISAASQLRQAKRPSLPSSLAMAS